MILEGLKDELVAAFKTEAADFWDDFTPEEKGIVERALVHYGELQLMVLAAKYDKTIDMDAVNADLEAVFATMASMTNVAQSRAKKAIRDVVYSVLGAVLKLAITALL